MSIDPIFAKYLSKSQIQNLNLAGIHSLYSLLIFLPYSLENLLPIDQFYGGFGEESSTVKNKYLMHGRLTQITKNQGRTGQSYYYLNLQSGNKNINCYYFASSQFAAKNLIVGNEFQAILTNSNNLWSIEKIVECKIVASDLSSHSNTSSQPFKLGQSKVTKYLLPKYSKTGFLQSPFFSQVFLQIPKQFFKLNLQGLVPENPIIPTEIDFWNIHHPESQAKYHTTMQQWIGLKVFLKLSLMKYLEKNKEKKYAKSSDIDLDFLKNLSSNLPFELSSSQKNAIWSILSEVKEPV